MTLIFERFHLLPDHYTVYSKLIRSGFIARRFNILNEQDEKAQLTQFVSAKNSGNSYNDDA